MRLEQTVLLVSIVVLFVTVFILAEIRNLIIKKKNKKKEEEEKEKEKEEEKKEKSVEK